MSHAPSNASPGTATTATTATAGTSAAPSAPPTTRLEDYRPPSHLALRVELLFELHEDHALVTSTVEYAPNPDARRDADEAGMHELCLDGRQLQTLALRLDGDELQPGDYALDAEHLRLAVPPAPFVLQAVTRIEPQANTTLEGLYRSRGTFCTQMEAEGFRRVTWFLDRPDVLSVYTTTLVADPRRYPLLLSNGNLVDSGPADGGRHYATWHDPHKKPCYLFALVAGDLHRTAERFTTRSGRTVALELFVDKGNEHKVAHAMASLQRAMAWDERAFGREYDLDVFMVVAVSEFNMGAMENKGLNLFNDQLVLARPETATDEDYQRIEGVIGHEYFHNWSGNRVTCRDWFQLSLKEGLTVYRDQEFSADMGDRDVKRIADVRWLRSMQFPEDAGPLAHPVRPRAYISIDNFYTRTIYEKGAEVIRMAAVLLGPERFRQGCDLYFARHDGQAVTTEEFMAALEAASGVDLSQFRRWYEQAGTPRLHASGRYDARQRTYELVLEQDCPATPGQPTKEPFVIPVRMGLLLPDGSELPLRLEGEDETAGAPGRPATAAPTTRVLALRRRRQSFRFVGVPAQPVPSLLRGFSAPVKLVDDLGHEALAFLARHDTDLFNRWEALQRLATSVLLELAAAQRAGRALALPGAFVGLVGALLVDERLPPALRAELLELPDESALADACETVDVEALHAASRFACRELAAAHRAAWLATYEGLADVAAGQGAAAAGARALRNACLGYLVELDEPALLQLCERHGERATTMTDEQCALELLAHRDDAFRDRAVQRFEQRWSDDPLVLNKWFAAQASSRRERTADDVLALARHPRFDARNPNKLRALYRSFARNPLRFHAPDGRGYALLADAIAALDEHNPVLAGRLAAHFDGWRRYDARRRDLSQAALRRLLERPGCSRNLFETVSRTLA